MRNIDLQITSNWFETFWTNDCWQISFHKHN